MSCYFIVIEGIYHEDTYHVVGVFESIGSVIKALTSNSRVFNAYNLSNLSDIGGSLHHRNGWMYLDVNRVEVLNNGISESMYKFDKKHGYIKDGKSYSSKAG